MNALRGRWLTLLFMAAAGAMLWSSFGLSRVSGWIPRSVLAATLLLLCWQFLRDRRATASAPGHSAESARRGARERAAALWIGGLLLSAGLLGPVPGSALFCLAWLRWHAGERWPASLSFAAAFGIALWLVFVVLLGADLYPGLLWRTVS